MQSSSPRSRRAVPVVLLAALLVVVAVPAVVWWIGQGATQKAAAHTGVPRCEGADVVPTNDDGFRAVAIRMDEGFVCTLTIRVTNRSDREVTLGNVRIPVAGPAARSGYRVTHIGGDPVRGFDMVEAETDLGWAVQAGDEEDVPLRVVFRPQGCASPGLRTWTIPTIEVRDLLATRDLDVVDLPEFIGTTDTSCDT
ncbi:hypothetical protein [Nocardioides coralli]|uniref:hypothetical protein n=1 Tax=Nocardioides coralli TaxID=2872154 RepID=UPI001CA3ED86|nr:hypothetical protein [Nocardioides coralli]QZY29139.1 hypothetical protein K6T13_17220 [Nocardioides coralli]